MSDSNEDPPTAPEVDEDEALAPEEREEAEEVANPNPEALALKTEPEESASCPTAAAEGPAGGLNSKWWCSR